MHPLSRRLKRWLIVLAALLVVGIAFVWSLPEIVKWQALKQIPAITGRAASIEDIDINLSDILRKLATAKEGEPAPPPPDPKVKSRWTIALDHFALIRANITVTDRAVKPTADWKVRDLTIEAGNLTTRPSGPVGTLAVRAALNNSPVEFSARDIDLTPTSFAGKFSIQNCGRIEVVPYLPPMPVVLDSGIAGVDIAVKLELGKGPSGLAVGLVTGHLALTSLALSQPGKPAPFLTVPRIAVGLKEVNLVSREVAIASVDIEGVDLKAVRDKQERIDLLGLAEKPASPDPLGSPSAAPRKAPAAPPAAPGPPVSAAKAAPEFKVTVEKVTLKAAATFTDESVSTPPTVLKVSNLAVQLDDVTWPNVRPINLTVGLNPPGGGKIGAKGAVTIEPLDLTLTLNTRDAPLEPYRSYFPFPAIFGGRFSSDSQNRVRITNGKLTALSRGNSWATDLTVKTADGQATPLRMERLEINGIDFGWPTHARVAKVRLKAPAAELDRGPDGINVQKLFTPNPVGSPSAAPPQAPAAAPAAPSSGAPAKSPGPLETMELRFKEIALEDGYVRFLDRTTTPPFSEDISKLAVTVRDLSNTKSQRASLLMQALIGGDSALDVRGELSAIGAPTYVDMVADLKKLALPTANPYVEGAIGWVIRRGELTTKLEYRIEEDKLDAKNDILVGNLKVSPAKEADEVKKRIGLPLGLIVALIKDGDGNIHVEVPVSGTLSDKKFDFGDAIWTAVRNVLVNVLKAPFRAIGGLFTSGDDKIEEIKVDPLVFAAGSSVLGPELERQAVRVADFMRRSPYVSLTLSSVTSPADVETLKERAVAARLQKFQQEQGIPDQATALRRYYQVIVKDAQLPMSIEDQLLLLRGREPEPTGPLAELRQRRLEVARARLTKVEGIPEARVQAEAAGGAAATTATPAPAGAPSAAAAGAASPSSGGRVEFGIGGESD